MVPERSALGIGSDVVAFAIERLVCSGSAAVEWRQSLVRGDRYSFVVELSPWAHEATVAAVGCRVLSGVRPNTPDRVIGTAVVAPADT